MSCKLYALENKLEKDFMDTRDVHLIGPLFDRNLPLKLSETYNIFAVMALF